MADGSTQILCQFFDRRRIYADSDRRSHQVFGVNDHDSARLVSNLLGQETVVFETMSRTLNNSWDGASLTFSAQHTSRPLLTPDEVRNLPQSRQLIFLAGRRPIVANKLRYYADPEFKASFDAT